MTATLLRAFSLALLLGAAVGAAGAQDRAAGDAAVPSGASKASFDPAQPVTRLDQAIAAAYASNPRLLAQRSTLRSTDALYPGARAAYGPQLTLEGRHAFARDRVEQIPGTFFANQGFSSTATLVLTQPLFGFGRRYAAESSAKAQIEFGRNQLRLIEAQTMLAVIRDYASVVRDRRIVAISAENLALLERQLSDSGARFRVHEITATDLQQVETRVEAGRAQLLSARGQLGDSQSRFLQSVGALPGDLAEPPPLGLGVASLDEAYAAAERNSPLLAAAQAREKVSRAELAGARAEQYPDLALQSTGAYGAVTPYENSRRTTELRSAVVVAVPLIDSSGRRARIEQAGQANDADWRLIDAALRDTRQSVATAWDAYRAAALSVDHWRAASEAARKAYEGAVLQQKAGDRTTLDVLDLARDLLSVRINFASAQASETIARATLIAAMGNLEGPQLVPGLDAYDPDANFRRQQRRGDIPLLTPALSGLDSVIAGDTKVDKPLRDPSASLRVESAVEGAAPAPAGEVSPGSE